MDIRIRTHLKAGEMVVVDHKDCCRVIVLSAHDTPEARAALIAEYGPGEQVSEAG